MEQYMSKNHSDTIIFFCKCKLSLPLPWPLPLSQNVKNEHKHVLYKSGGLLSEIHESSTNGAGVRMKQHKPNDPATTVNRATPPLRVYERSCARPGRQSAGTCPFSPNQHKVLRLWQQNLLAFPWSPTKRFVNITPMEGPNKRSQNLSENLFLSLSMKTLT